MLITNPNYINAYKSQAREITGKVSYEAADGSLVDLTPDGDLVSFSIEKTAPSGKLFGFAVSQKITVEVLGIHEAIQKGTKLVPFIGAASTTENVELPHFYVENITINKVNNTTTITGYDLIHSNSLVIGDITFTYPLTVSAYAAKVVEAMGGVISFETSNFNNFEITEAPNFNGNESVQIALAALAEATGTVCYVRSGNTVKFRRISSVSTINDELKPDHYFDFSVGEMITLTKVASATTLGDNVSAGSEGFTHVLWDNPFLALREDLNTRLSYLFIDVNGANTSVYKADWRGCPAYEIGDRITFQEKDGKTRNVFYFNETLTYNGGLHATSDWDSIESERVEAAPASVSKTIKQTYAKVDKVNQEIELLASQVDEATEEVSNLKVTTSGIVANVSRIDEEVNDVKAQITPENLSILIGSEIDSVRTETGFTFNDAGLTIYKTGTSTTTNIDEDGLTIYNLRGDDLLTVDNNGINAINVNANTYLIIGNRSRFENYTNENGNVRTGCFWLY